MANHQSEVEKLSASIAALEAQRAMLGDAVVDPAIAALRQQISQAAAAIEKETPEDERKLVTIVFADISGFTALSEKKDPEEVRELINACFQSLVPIVQKYEGTIDKFIGDEIMALFGAPVAHEDDPERALRAALAIRDWIVEEGKLQVRIGVNTGEALVNLAARPESGEGMAAGDVVNTAVRLQSAAPTNGILVGETTYRATQQTIDFGEAHTVGAKGKEEPVRVWEVVQARASFGVDLAAQARGP